MTLVRQAHALALVLGFALMARHTAVAADNPNLGQIKLQDFRYGGTGCPNGMATGLIAEDGESLTVIFDDFVISSDSPDGAIKHCHINFLLSAEGWQHALFSVDTRGHASIDQGASALIATSYQVPGTRPVTIGRTQIKGEIEDDYLESFNIPLEAVTWSQCKSKQSLRLDTSIRLKTPDQTEALLSVDTIDGALSNQIGILWRNCEPKKQKKYLALCKIRRQWQHQGRLRYGEQVVHAKSNTKDLALSKARKKALRRCAKTEKGDAKRGHHCITPTDCHVYHLKP